jgi:hypothetical protein
VAEFRITSLALPKHLADAYDILGPLSAGQEKMLSQLGKVNLFVGENNSGKSRLLRGLAGAQKLHTHHTGVDALESFRRKWLKPLHEIESREGLTSGTISLLRGYALIDFVEEEADFTREWGATLNQLSSMPVVGGPHGVQEPVRQEIITVGSKARQEFLESDFGNKLSFTKIYIPALRGLRDIGHSADVYFSRTWEDYFKENPAGKPEVFTGLNLFNEYRSLLLGSFEKRQWARDFESFISRSFFSGRPMTLIPSEQSKTLEVKIGTEKERPIHSLGDGIQAIIILTFPLFKNREKPTLVFFEEPEICLHPGYQRLFQSVLLNNFPNQQYFLTTHSNHFLDITADKESVSVFTFRREITEADESPREQDARYSIENVSNDDVRPLELLGVRNSSVLLSNCTIWVEGITDRRYLAKWLKLFVAERNRQTNEKAEGCSLRAQELAKDFREDLHFSFVEYSGSNITHWSFLDEIPDAVNVKRLCGKVFLIADKDDPKEGGKKASRPANLKANLGDNFKQLPCREIENLLTPSVIAAVLTDMEKKPVAFAAKQQDYENAGLGSFIENHLRAANFRLKRRYAHGDKTNDSTIVPKVQFCARALEHMKDFADLSHGARDLTEAVYKFIAENNQ